MLQVPIKRSIDGGMMIVPLFAGALFKTFVPGVPQFFGSFTGALFTAPLTILAVFYVCMGATLVFRATPFILKKGGALFAAKIVTAVVLGRSSSGASGTSRRSGAACSPASPGVAGLSAFPWPAPSCRSRSA